MKIALHKALRASLLLASVTALVSCGGGGDFAGDSSEFSTSPDKLTRTVTADANGGCSRAFGSEVFVTIVGGQAPFRIQNPLPNSVRVDRTEASGKDPVFKVTSLGGCVDPVTILVLDYHSQSATFELTVEAEEATTTTPAE